MMNVKGVKWKIERYRKEELLLPHARIHFPGSVLMIYESAFANNAFL